MKPRIFAFLLSLLCLFLCGCDLHSSTLSGDVYTDFSNDLSTDFTSSFNASFSQRGNQLNTQISHYDNQTSKQNTNINISSSSNINYTSSSFLSSKNSTSIKSSSSNKKSSSSKTSSFNSSSSSVVKLSTIKITNSNKSAFKTVGRCETGNSKGLALAWGGSSIEFFLHCKDEISLSFSFENNSHPVYVRIELDNNPSMYEQLEIASDTSITLNINDSLEKHSIKIIRLSDAEAAPLVLNSISTYGDLVEVPPQDKPLFIEAIGSNNFCGQGLLLENTQNTYTESEINNPKFADTTLTYPYLASKRLNADCYLFARKGAGFVATNILQNETINNTPQLICNPLGTFLFLYNRINLHSEKEYVPQRNPNIIIIDAGIADSQLQLLNRVYFNGKLGVSKTQAVSITANFLNSLKGNNPNVKIVWCYGMTSTNKDYLNFITSVVAMVNNSSDFVYTLSLPKAANTNFPTAEEHNLASKILYQKLKNII